MRAPAASHPRVFAVLGDPVSHSLSPAFQNAALEAAGLHGVYVALRSSAAELPGLLRGLAFAGGGGNVTGPHKELAARTVDRGTDAVRRTGACNTFWAEGEEVWGDNTDVAGFAAAARGVLGAPLDGARVLLLGAGGAASAVVAALVDGGAAAVTIANRSPERALLLADRFGGTGAGVRVAAGVSPVAAERFDLVVNATPLGRRDDDPLPIEHGATVPFGAALDLVYSPRRTRWVRELRSRGVPADDGLEMLLRQGAAAFERWWGIPAPLPEMRAALPRAE